MVVYAKQEEQLDASVFNLWRRARLRLGSPQRLCLPDMEHIALIMNDKQWLVVDQRQSDMPLIGWTFSQYPGLDSLHAPVDCTFHYYHFMAHYMGGELKGRVISQMQTSLESLLQGCEKPDTSCPSVQRRQSPASEGKFRMQS